MSSFGCFWHFHATIRQQFFYYESECSDKGARLVHVNSGLCLDGTLRSGSKVKLALCDGALTQAWWVYDSAKSQSYSAAPGCYHGEWQTLILSWSWECLRSQDSTTNENQCLGLTENSGTCLFFNQYPFLLSTSVVSDVHELSYCICARPNFSCSALVQHPMLRV